MTVFFLPSKFALSGKSDSASIVTALAADKKIAFSFFTTFLPVWDTLGKEFTSSPIKIRNESEVFCVRGIYNDFLDKYKDDYFHVGLVPAIITYKTFDGFVSPFGTGAETERYEIRCFDKIVMDTYYNPRGQILLSAKIIRPD